ncbi:uncharacterized protein C8R40DRAFT_1076912 [Lentinula edodes]|uniref:uncharacterized protein n=1 Tax=Lentinula edodes TaxID=5353 RepID=UPI001E8D6C55|nr:uncharacterized protein C8R40DRAFT_1076912 [Lentinula edodes]KAH7881188.1 hypothetical protein C8R40DRAFT_1076912 [Lentinula edodes]
MHFSSLPAEIYAAFIEQLDEPDVRATLLALTRAIPRSPVPRYQLFRRINITKADQLISLYQRIRPRKQDIEHHGEDPCKWVQGLYLETWTADAEIVLNLLTLLPNLEALTIWIGPKNFTPEHLEELFSVDRGGRSLRCVENLLYLSLRFRPYVQKATYHQFLSGSYFDSILEALSRWPPGRLSTLSIVQDPLSMESGTSEGSEASPPPTFSLGLPQRTLASGFAQPIVFFQLESTFPGLLRAPYLHVPLKYLRLRFPSRNIIRSLTQEPVPYLPSYGASIPAGSKPSKRYVRHVANAHLPPTPYLQFLDLSTCLISERSLPQILIQYPSLTHIILDDCNILRNGDIAVRDDSREWGSIAMSCAIAGIGKAKEKEKLVTAWLNMPGVRQKREQKLDDRDQYTQNKRRTRGRKGIANASISIHKKDITSGSSITEPQVHDAPERIRILPPLPTLRHLTANLYVPPSMIPSETCALPPDVLDPLLVNIHREWERGWAEGLAQLVKVRERLHTSWRNNLVRVMRFATPEEMGSFSNSFEKRLVSLGTEGGSLSRSHSPTNSETGFSETSNDENGIKALEDPLTALIEVTDRQEFDLDISDTSSTGIGKAPVLCLAGSSLTSSMSSEQNTLLLYGVNMGTVCIQGLDHASSCAHVAGRKLWLDGIP